MKAAAILGRRFTRIEVWAQLFLCQMDCARIGDFLVSEFGVERSCIVRRMHITVYHARRPMPHAWE